MERMSILCTCLTAFSDSSLAPVSSRVLDRNYKLNFATVRPNPTLISLAPIHIPAPSWLAQHLSATASSSLVAKSTCYLSLRVHHWLNSYSFSLIDRVQNGIASNMWKFDVKTRQITGMFCPFEGKLILTNVCSSQLTTRTRTDQNRKRTSVMTPPTTLCFSQATLKHGILPTRQLTWWLVPYYLST